MNQTASGALGDPARPDASVKTEVELRTEEEIRMRSEEALRQSEQTYRRLFEGNPLPMWIFDPGTLAFLDVNEAAVGQYGYSREEFLSMTLRDIRPVEDVPHLLRSGEMPRRHPGPSLRGAFRHRRKDASLVEVEVYTQEFAFQGRPARLALIHDVTERRREKRMLKLLADSGVILGSSLDYRTTLKNIARLFTPAVADHCSIDLVGEAGEAWRVEVAFSGAEREDVAERLKERFAPRPGSPQPAAEAMRTGESLLVGEVSDQWLREHACDEEHLEILRALGVRSVVVVPLIARGHTIGAITLTTGESGRRLDGPDLAIVEAVAQRAALAIDNARLYQESQRAVRAREEVLAVVSHDLQRPLNAVRSVLDMFLEGRSPQAWRPQDRRQLKALQGAAAQMAGLIRDLVEVTRNGNESGQGRAGAQSQPDEKMTIHSAAPAEASRSGAPPEGLAEARRTELLRPMSKDSEIGLCDELRHRIASALHLGYCQPGERLPSIREIHRSLKVPLSTVVRVYGQLEAEGLVEKRERSGVYLAPQERPGGELLSETAQWLAEVIAGAYEQQIKAPHLPELMRRWTAGVRLRCACVESDQDQLTALCREMQQHFGLDAHPVSAADLPAFTPGTPVNVEALPPALRDTELVVTTAFHSAPARAAAEALRTPVVVMTVSPEAVATAERTLRERHLTVVCTDPRFGERICALAGERYRERVRVVLADDREALARLDPSEPVLLTRAARERLAETNVRLLLPLSPAFSASSVRSLARVIIRLNMEAAQP